MLLIKAEWLARDGRLDEGPFFVTVEGETITSIHTQDPSSPAPSSAPPPAEQQQLLHTFLLTPGFIDLHTHGVGGSEDVIEFWQHPEYTKQIFPSQATTSFLASVIFPRDHPEKIAAVLERLAPVVGDTAQGAVLEGVHAEGPVIHDLGAMPPADCDISLGEFELLVDSIPSLRVMTISPHLEAGRGYERIKALVERGVVPALGHDRVASETEILGALSCGKEKRMHITHLFNVCSFHHRSPSLVNFGLCDQLPDLPKYTGISPPTVELIGDLFHVHPMVLTTVLKSRDYKDVIFVSDSILEPKPGATVNYLDRKIVVSDDCRSLSLVGEKVLAGSCCSLLDTFHSLIRVLKVPTGRAVSMLSENPARIAGLSHVGKVAGGMRADLLLFDEDMNLSKTLVAGKIAHTNS